MTEDPTIFRWLRIPLRLTLWLSPLLWTLALLVTLRGLHEDAVLSQTRALLVDGNCERTLELLGELQKSPWTGRQARAGIELAAAMAGVDSPVTEGERFDLDVRAFPVALIIRAAFERGEFPAVLRLTEVAESLGVGTVPVVTAAAWIETGDVDRARRYVSARAVPGTMARRVAHHLATPEQHQGVMLRDRFGRPLGKAIGDALELDAGVQPELVPRAVTTAAVDAYPGAGSLRLTLDYELSQAAYRSFGRYRGSIVIVDTRSGEILAAVSDRRTYRKGGTPAFEQYREPASIAKLMTTTAARRAGYQPDDELRRMRCRGHETYSGKPLYCPTIVGPLRGLDRAMALSCNVAFANLGVRVGRRGMIDELRRYGFESPRGQFPGGRILEAYGDDRQLADISIGLQATEITPLHAALLAAVMANDGVMPEPTLVAAQDGRLGLHPRPGKQGEGHRVIESEWVPELVDAMTAVVRGGTAQRVWPPHNFPVAMKTGTASDPRYGFHVNYIGIGPMPNPHLAFCVRVTDRPTSVKVRYAAKQVTYQLLRNLGRLADRRGWTTEPPAFDYDLPPRMIAEVPDRRDRRRGVVRGSADTRATTTR